MAVPLVAPVAANAAMGGAIPLTTTLRPDLRSATVKTVDLVNGTQDVEFCFNKDIGSTPAAGRFSISDYDQGVEVADSAIRSQARCASARFSTRGDIDIPRFTYATAAADAVVNSANGAGNVQDSIALAGSDTSNGTRGLSTAPDLTGITVNNGADSINYIFDQKISAAAAPGAMAFRFQRQDGTSASNTTAAMDVTVADNVVTAKFATGTVNQAVRASVIAGAVQARAHPGTADANAAAMSAVRPGSSGFTDNPDLQSATVSSTGSTVAFVYDQPVGAGTNGQVLVTSDAQAIALGTPTAASSGNTLVFNVPNGTNINEYFVMASSPTGAASATTGATPSTVGSVPVGGNAGAKSAGFSTGPEALTVTFNTSNGVANVLFDQRFATSNNAGFILIDDTGAQISGTPTNVSTVESTSTAGRVNAQVSFTSQQLQGARSILIIPGAVTTTPINGVSYSNVVQALSPTASAAVLKKGSKAKFRPAKGLKNTKQLRAVRRALAG